MSTTWPQGPFTFAQAAAAGASRKRFRRALAAGELRRVLRGVYAVGWAEDSVELRARALALVVRTHQVVCDRTAAWLHGVDVFGLTDKEVLPEVEVCALRGRAVTRLTGVDGRTRDLIPDDLMTVEGVRVTTPLRTALDLGCNLGKHRALGALDQFMRLHELRHGDMLVALPRFHGRRGVVQLRQLIPLADGRAESMRESWVRLDIHLAGLPKPELQYSIVVNGVERYRLDLAYPAHRVVVEYDGEEFHKRTDDQREKDETRRNWLRDHGWTVIVVDKQGIHDPSQAWLDELAESLKPMTRRLRWARPA